jgi:molybdate transport system substrate-binding protein
VVLAGSPALARQIAAGAPADVVWLADAPWMDWLAERRLVAPASIRVVASNRLVLIHPAGRPASLATLARTRWTTADPDGVPLGRYARAALISSGLWERTRPNLAAAADARAALALVERGVVRAGIVYATDARASRRVRVAAVLPAGSHPPVVYPAALTPRAAPDAAAFVAMLASPAGQRLLARRGFTPPPRATNPGG